MLSKIGLSSLQSRRTNAFIQQHLCASLPHQRRVAQTDGT